MVPCLESVSAPGVDEGSSEDYGRSGRIGAGSTYAYLGRSSGDESVWEEGSSVPVNSDLFGINRPRLRRCLETLSVSPPSSSQGLHPPNPRPTPFFLPRPRSREKRRDVHINRDRLLSRRNFRPL